MNSKKLLFFALLISVLLHVIFGITVESYLRLLLKKAHIGGERDRYFEVLPYSPKNLNVSPKAPKDARILGPSNFSPPFEEAPKIDKFLGEKFVEQVLPKPPEKKEEIVEKQEIPKQPVIAKTEPLDDNGRLKQDGHIVERPVTEKKLPPLEKLVPRTPELIAKMPKEENINLNRGTVKEGKELIIATKEYKYWSYLDKMKRKIELLWQYPEVAIARGLSGSLKINFSVDKSGRLKQVVLVESSGYKFFDDAAMKALRDSEPFAPFPDTWDIEKLNIEGTFIYELKVIR